MPFYNQPSVAPLSPPLPESQAASYVTYKERHIRPHAYRPFRIPSVKKETTAHDFITRLLSLGDQVPHGAFLPPSKPRGPVGATSVSRVDRPSREACIETSTLPKLSLRRQRTVHPQSPAAATSLGRGASCSSTASTIRPAPQEPKNTTKTPKPLPSLKILAPLPFCEIITSPIKDTLSPPSSEDEEVVTPQHGCDIELPLVNPEEISEQELETKGRETATMPGTPLNIPPTPLDIPVDWDDLRQRWSPHGSTHQSAQEEGWCEEDDATYGDIPDGALVEEKEEPPAPTHAYAAGGMTPSTSVSEIKLSSITSKDLGECFLLEPMQLQLHTPRASALFSEEGWPSSLCAPVGARVETVRGPITSPTPGVGPISGPILDAGVPGLSPVPLPTTADFPPPRTAVPLNTSIAPLSKTTLGSTTKASTLPPSALKSQSQARKKRHGRLVSFDEAALVMRTVRFSCTLDPQFDYAKMGHRNSSSVGSDRCLIEELVSAGSEPRKEESLAAGDHS